MFRKKSEDKKIDITSLNHILVTGKRIINIGYFMSIIALILLGTYLIKEWKILKYLQELIVILSPIFMGFIIAWFFEPAVSWLQEKKIPRILGCILVYLCLLGILFLIAYLFIPSLISQVKDFMIAAPTIFESLAEFLMGILNKINAGSLVDLDELQKTITDSIMNYGLSVGTDMPKYIFILGKSIINGGLNLFLGLMIGFYLLYDFDKVNKNIYQLLPKDWKASYLELTDRINNSLRNYVQGVLMVMLLVFITQSIGLTIAGLKAPILFALFCALTDIIPYFGPYIGAIPAIIVGFTISPITGICVVIAILVVQLLENNFYQPLIMGHTMKLHPVTIMLGLLLFQHFFGIIGMVIATPCVACTKVIFLFISEKTGFSKYFESEKEIEDTDNEESIITAQ